MADQDTKKNIIKVFHSKIVEDLYKELTKGDEEKCVRFKQIFIDLVCKDPEIDLIDRAIWEKFKEDIEKGMESGALIDSHDNVIKTNELEEYKGKEETDPPPGNSNAIRNEDVLYEIQKGLALVLWNTDFLIPNSESIDTNQSRRKIGDEDRRTMGNILPHYNIKVIGQEEFKKECPGDWQKSSGGNLLKDEVKELIEDVRKKIEKEEPDIFICVVSTHANEVEEAKTADKQGITRVPQMLSFKDGALGKTITTDELVSEFNDTKCPSLKGKPRLFFIEACRSRISKATEVIAACELRINEMEKEIEEYERLIKERKEEKEIEECERLIKERKESITKRRLTIDACKFIQKEEKSAGLPVEIHVLQKAIGSNVKPDSKENVDKAQAKSFVPFLNDEAKHGIKQGVAGNPGSSSDSPDISQTNESKDNTQDPVNEPVCVDVVSYEVNPSPCYDHSLIMYAAPPGKTAYGRIHHGGWMIGALSKVLNERKASPEVNILDVLTQVCDTVVREMTYTEKDEESNIEWHCKVVPCIEHKLLKDVTLKPKK